MRLVHVDHSGAVLREESGRIVVRSAGERIATLPLKTVDRLVVTSAAVLDAGLLLRLQDRGAGILLAPAAFRRFAPVHVVPARADAARRMRQYRVAADPPAAARIARGLVRLRLAGQIELLQGMPGAERGRAAEAVAALRRAVDRLGGDPGVDEARGLEGAGAAAFFGAYRTAFAAALAFEARRRRPPPDPVNVCLSLGYTLAHHEALHAIAETGLDAACGFLHQPLSGRDGLACDVVEPLRAVVERFVAGLFGPEGLRPDHFSSPEGLRPDHFTSKDGACMMGKAGRRIFYERHAADAAPRLRHLARSAAAWLLREIGIDDAALATALPPVEDADVW